MTNSERWLPIPGYPDYQVSDFGNVKTTNWYSKGIEHAISKRWYKGRLQVQLKAVDGIHSGHYVQVLVYDAFNPGIRNSKQVRFKDGNPANCALTNLYLLDDVNGNAGLAKLTPEALGYIRARAAQAPTLRGLQSEVAERYAIEVSHETIRKAIADSGYGKRVGGRRKGDGK